MKVKGRSEYVLGLCREVEYRLPKHPLFDNFRKGLKRLQQQIHKKLVVTVINDLPDDNRYVTYRLLLSQLLSSEVASCVFRTNVYLNYSPNLDFKVTFPSGDKYTYSRDKRLLLKRYLPDLLEKEPFGESVQHIWKKYPATEDFYPLLCALLSLKSPAPGVKLEVFSPKGIENVTLLFPTGNEVDAKKAYWKNFLPFGINADKAHGTAASFSPTQNEGKTESTDIPETLTSGSSKSATALSSDSTKVNPQVKASVQKAVEKPTTCLESQPESQPYSQPNSQSESHSVAKGSSKPPFKTSNSSLDSSSDVNTHNRPMEFAAPSIAKAKLVQALEETNAYLVLSSVNELLSGSFLALLGRSHPLLSRNTVVVLEGDSHGLPGQQINDILSLSLGTSQPLWMSNRPGDAESFAIELGSFVNSSARKMEKTFITSMACTQLEVAAKDLKKMIELLTQEKKTVMSDNITPLDDYFNYYFSQSRLNDLIRKRSEEFKENFPNGKAQIIDYVSERINAAITSDELMNILDDFEVRHRCEYLYLTVHQFYLQRQRSLRDNFNLQLARLYSEFEANYHIDPMELELEFEKVDPVYRYKVSFDIFERMLNVLMKNTSDLEQAKAHMMNSVLARFQEDYTDLENYYMYHFRKSMQMMEQSVEKIRKEYHKFYRESIDQRSEAFLRKISGLQSELDSINNILEMLHKAPIQGIDN